MESFQQSSGAVSHAPASPLGSAPDFDNAVNHPRFPDPALGSEEAWASSEYNRHHSIPDPIHSLNPPYYPEATNLDQPESTITGAGLPQYATGLYLAEPPHMILDVCLSNDNVIQLKHHLKESAWHASEAFCATHGLAQFCIPEIAASLGDLREALVLFLFENREAVRLASPNGAVSTHPFAPADLRTPSNRLSPISIHPQPNMLPPTPPESPNSISPAAFTARPATRTRKPRQRTAASTSLAVAVASNPNNPLTTFSAYAAKHSLQPEDMVARVRRPVQERYDEVQRKGKVGRPMNAFMLYRAAYAQISKLWVADGSNGLISQQNISVSMGVSWNAESEEIKAFYARLAEEDRRAHAEAWPEYRFVPKKAGFGKRRREQDEKEDDWSEYEEYGKRNKKARAGWLDREG